MSLKELILKLKSYKSVGIFIHVHPDGDAVGSALALKSVLEKSGVEADIFCEDDIPEKFCFLSGAKDIKKEIERDYDCFVALDSADLTRIGKFQEIFLTKKNTFNVDHHISNTRFARENFVIDNASNSENVFEMIEQELDRYSANALATGIITDTGGFRHKNVTESTLEKAKVLFSSGADFNEIFYNTFTAQSKERAKLFGITMSNLRYLLDGKLAIALISLENLSLTKALPEETEGFIDFIMGIKGVEVGVCLLETEKDKYKVSFRSKTADVNAVASSFGGGGHKLASGCKIAGEYEEVVDKIRFRVSREI